MPYASFPYDQTSFGPPVASVQKSWSCGRRLPCSRMRGLEVPYWNQRISTSRYPGSSGPPPAKPPMSVFHQGIPLMATFSPALIWRAREPKVGGMSPDHSAAPYLSLPAHADRTRDSGRSSPDARSPSATARRCSRG